MTTDNDIYANSPTGRLKGASERLAEARQTETDRETLCATCRRPTDGEDVWTRGPLVIHARCIDFEKFVGDNSSQLVPLVRPTVYSPGWQLMLRCWGGRSGDQNRVAYYRGPYLTQEQLARGAAREIERRGRAINEERRRQFFAGRAADPAPDLLTFLSDMRGAVIYEI